MAAEAKANGSAARLAAAFRETFQEVVDEALGPVTADVETLKTDMKTVKAEVKNLKADTEQILELLTGGRP